MNYKIKKFFKNALYGTHAGRAIYKFCGDITRKCRKSISDEDYLKKSFRENNGLELNLAEPRTFNEKLLWLSLHDRTPLKTLCADKYRVREYLEKAGFASILNELYGVYHSTSEIDFSTLPKKFVLKTNHDSGTYVIVDQDDPSTQKEIGKLDIALGKNYYLESREWQYKDIQPVILCEKFIETDEPYGLADYRFFCSNGNILFVAVDIGTTESNGKHGYFAKRNLYNEEFFPVDAKLKREPFDKDLVPKPQNYDEMVRIAKTLSEPFKHVRVDLYNVQSKIIFGELTFVNGGGMQLLEPPEFNLAIGDMIDLHGKD